MLMTGTTAESTRILLITDDEHEKELTSFMLSCGGFDTQIALTAESALMLAARYRHRIVVIDMASRTLDPVDVAERLSHILDFRSHKLIAINASERSDQREKLVELHCQSFIESNAVSNLCSIIQHRFVEN